MKNSHAFNTFSHIFFGLDRKLFTANCRLIKNIASTADLVSIYIVKIMPMTGEKMIPSNDSSHYDLGKETDAIACIHQKPNDKWKAKYPGTLVKQGLFKKMIT